MTRAWLVDLDGTLYRGKWVRLVMAAELLTYGLGAISTIRSFRREHEILRAELNEPVESPWALQIERTAAALGKTPAQVETTVRVWMVERPGRWLRRFRRADLVSEIVAFRAGGGRTALVSDYPARAKLQALGATDLFDTVVANGEPGGPPRLKPWPDGYLAAAAQLGVEPGECLVLGDRDDADGEAARRAGMQFRRIA